MRVLQLVLAGAALYLVAMAVHEATVELRQEAEAEQEHLQSIRKGLAGARLFCIQLAEQQSLQANLGCCAELMEQLEEREARRGKR